MNYYLFFVDIAAITSGHFYPSDERLTIHYRSDHPPTFEVGDYLFLAQKTEQCVLPYIFSIVNINRQSHTLVIKVDFIYAQTLPLRAVLSLIGLSRTVSYSLPSWESEKLSKPEFEAIVNFMSLPGKRHGVPLPNDPSVQEQSVGYSHENLSGIEIEDANEEDEVLFGEEEVLDYVKDYIRNRGYYFEDETLYNYHICLKTRPFVILAGLSGTGKSKLAQLYAEALGHRDHFKRLPVRPNWNDDRYLLGHYNSLTGEYVMEPALEFILDAIKHHKHLYSLCLDEMNLAHVEYYFSQFLSAMEEERPEERCITLLGRHTYNQLQNPLTILREIYLPDNLLFTGTINVDETTQSISDKVIDRANTIEFFHVDLDKIPERKDPGEPLTIAAKAWLSYRAQEPDTSYRTTIVDINTILKDVDLSIGYRTVHEIEMYLANSKSLLKPQVAFDLQIKQRILPRVRGTEKIKETLKKLIDFSHSNKFERTEKRLKEMKNRLEHDGYTSFWR